MITKEDLQNKLLELARKAQTVGNIEESLSEYLTFVKDNYSQLDAEAKAIADKAIEIVGEGMKENIQNMPDSIEKRKLARMHAEAMGNHWNIAEITQRLATETYLTDPVVSETARFFFEYAQKLADFLHDVKTNTIKGTAIAPLILYCSALDELIVAFHLAQRGFGPQAFSHVRVVYETLDKVELFNTKPEYVSLWMSRTKEDRENARHELDPKGVRLKLGKKSYDPVFSFLSEMGSHVTWMYMQPKVDIKVSRGNNGLKGEAQVWVGGSPKKDSLVFANSGVVQALMVTLISFTTTYQQYLLEEEGLQVLIKAFEDYRKYMLDYFCKWMEENGTDTSKAREFLQNIKY